MSLPSLPNASASYFQFQQSLDQYVFFSPLTMGGASGRAVKIHKDLFLPFFCVVDPSTHDGQAIIRQIENLRTTCTVVRKETGSGYANNKRQGDIHKRELGRVNSAFHQVLIIKNLHVHYRVSQEAGDKAPGIYISSIRVVSESTSTSAPGLYESKTSFGSKVPLTEKMKTSAVDGKKVYINGKVQSKDQAMKNARYATNDNNSLLFYCPARVSDELGIMGSSVKSNITNNTLNELINVIKQNQKASRGVSWYVDGEGANVLAQALKQIPGDLSSHEFRFINPIANTAKLLESLTDKKAKLEGEFFKYDQNRTALMSLGVQKDELLKAIGKLPAGKNYDIITRSYILKSINDLSNAGTKAAAQEAKLPTAIKTFVQLLKAAGAYRK
jgi:hypothetical protein